MNIIKKGGFKWRSTAQNAIMTRRQSVKSQNALANVAQNKFFKNGLGLWATFLKNYAN